MSKQDSQNQLMQPAAEHATIVSIHHPRVNSQRNPRSNELFTDNFKTFWLVRTQLWTAIHLTNFKQKITPLFNKW